jgi:hypothetical protein
MGVVLRLTAPVWAQVAHKKADHLAMAGLFWC